MNNSFATAICTTPSELVTGLDKDNKARHLGEVNPSMNRKALKQKARLGIALGQAAMKEHYNEKHRPVEFKPDDWV
ncbi:hypothetical protein PT974_00211 [Cladobotryum mycophilum]|uniref:Uncharacterized protein n=1 Tax=Cladobotryum mycophilum TaxID=491253 RepID=A0ABR0T130_9HYPO